MTFGRTVENRVTVQNPNRNERLSQFLPIQITAFVIICNKPGWVFVDGRIVGTRGDNSLSEGGNIVRYTLKLSKRAISLMILGTHINSEHGSAIEGCAT